MSEDIRPGDGWIEWSGGECPVAPETQIEIRCKEDRFNGSCRARECCWEHGGDPNRAFMDGWSDIIAYRVVSGDTGDCGGSK